jgi:hypothetical protein
MNNRQLDNWRLGGGKGGGGEGKYISVCECVRVNFATNPIDDDPAAEAHK